ncbi:phosphoenolpyruvate carboxykinase (ATP) [Clostridium sp. DSM 8431]|uniref:phosphoenolpyruvate carboxykinase (ATP) n=1 Tax=Clostridium sp. DSM 8431 TaxID=1761781 RepID=UPI0008E3E484|nr:phosphoenolpyruvate carboxykinase (ATP) [Clostridium sp. DSM 8431]SFU88070.1 phosphoenolpyruvate carboxykinase (ATP) [Clostridium sp. DSM 8431]
MNLNLEYLNIKNYSSVSRNLSAAELIECAIKRGEGTLTDKGALDIITGKYTGRSPKDRFIVKDDVTKEKINWGTVNLPIDTKTFDSLYDEVTKYLENKDIFVFDGSICALKDYSVKLRVVCEKAYQALFVSNMFIRPTKEELLNHVPEFNIISAPGFKVSNPEKYGINSEAFVLINFTKKIVLIGGTGYSGEIKKAMFSAMNFLLPEKGVLPMHCSANIGEDGKTVVFFGLSGTGKTTLSTDPNRRLIGDDEHGWCDKGVFNFEGGCYAKVIGLDKEKEKEIYEAIKFGTVLENVVLDENRLPDYKDKEYTENTRASYPINFIDNIEPSGVGNVPQKIIFLTADATGVMPPVSKLSKEAAMYHFMSGYTSKVAGTERGIVEPQATFSACFGEPFMLLNPAEYAKLLGEKINEGHTEVYLINTGWVAGGYGVGDRIKLKYTRSMVNAVINDDFKNVEFVDHPVFNLSVPKECPYVPSEVLDARGLWADKEAYDKKALELAESFKNNFKKFKNVTDDIVNAGIR